MKQLILFFGLLISNYSFSQHTDTIPKKTFENFFGCDCCQDTVELHIVYKQKFIYECTLYKTTKLLVVRKKGRVVWKADLEKDLKNIELEYLCIFDLGDTEKGKERIYITNGHSIPIRLYLKNGKRVK
jgi:hypothetical protein